MIKLLLSYMIFETCLENLFNAIRSNFPIGIISMEDLQVGSYVSVSLVVYNRQYKLHGCKVIEKNGTAVILEYAGFESPILLVVNDGKLIDIKGNRSVLFDSFMESYL